MGDLVNLRTMRKRRARADADAIADETRTRHGLSKAFRVIAETEAKRAARSWRLHADGRGLSVPALVALIDRERAPEHNLSSAIRVFVLAELVARIEEQQSVAAAAQKFHVPA